MGRGAIHGHTACPQGWTPISGDVFVYDVQVEGASVVVDCVSGAWGAQRGSSLGSFVGSFHAVSIAPRAHKRCMLGSFRPSASSHVGVSQVRVEGRVHAASQPQRRDHRHACLAPHRLSAIGLPERKSKVEAPRTPTCQPTHLWPRESTPIGPKVQA